MMRPLIQHLFDTSKYTSLVDKDRARLIYGLLYFAVAGYAIYVLFVRGSSTANLTPVFTDVTFFLLFGGALWSLRSGRINGAAVITLILIYAAGVLDTVRLGFVGPADGAVLILFVVLAGLLNRERGLVAGTILMLVSLIVGISLRATLPVSRPPESGLYDFFSISISVLVVSLFTFLFLRSTRLSRIEGESRATEERIKLAELTSETARRIANRLALNEVLSNAVEQIRANFPDIYHAQIFLVDEEGQVARLAASTGETGKFLMQRRHSLNVGSLSVIGQVTLTGEPMIARAGDPNSIHRRNEALPETSAEAAFPLRIGNKVIGALDLQSRVESAFREDDIPAFQLLADHIAVAIDNARLFEETEERLRDNQQLVEQARSAVREVERLNRQLTGRAWAEYLHGKGEQLNRSVDFTNNTVRQEDAWTPTMQEAVQYNYVAENQQGDAQVIAIPIRVRGQVIGAIEFELDKESSLSPEYLALIQEVGERFGLAAENTRLFEQSQRIAQREALVNEIGVRLQASNNIEATLAEAARSLKQTLRADKVAIRLGTPPAANGNGGSEQ